MWFVLDTSNNILANYRTRTQAEEALKEFPAGSFVCPPSKLLHYLSMY
jgi:hypothetical protein